MNTIELFYIVLVIIQLLHSQEEIYTHFEKRWPLWKMSRKTFVSFEIIFSILIVFIIFMKTVPYRDVFMLFFNLLMFANGIWHLMWAAVEKKYIPGLITAPLFILVFILFYFQILIK